MIWDSLVALHLLASWNLLVSRHLRVMRISVLHHSHLFDCDVLHSDILIYHRALPSLQCSHRLSISAKSTLVVLI